MTIERVRGAAARAEVLELLRRRQPETTSALLWAQRPGPRRHTKMWIARTDGRVSGLLVGSRYCFDRWNGLLLVDDPDCAADLARVLDRSSVWWVYGPADGVEQVLAHARRARGSVRLWFYSIPPQPPEAADGLESNGDVAVRPADPRDADALVELYALDEHNGAVPRRRLRRVVAGRLADTLVAESNGGVVGAMWAASTDTYRALDSLIVHPDARGRRIGMALLIRAGLEAVAVGRGICGLRAMTNGLRLGHDEVLMFGDAEVWAASDLRPPRKFRGQPRLRRLLERLEGGVLAPPSAEPSPYSVLPEQADSARHGEPAGHE